MGAIFSNVSVAGNLTDTPPPPTQHKNSVYAPDYQPVCVVTKVVDPYPDVLVEYGSVFKI